jgi:hypothetical protein
MIEDPVLARVLFEGALSCSCALDQSVAAHQARLSEMELSAYKRAVGVSMATLFDQILAPIGRRHPEVLPETWKSWFK